MRTFDAITRSTIAFALTAICASVASAQQPAGGAQGPLVLTPVPTTIIFSPDAKVTTVNHTTATLAGAYVGKLYDDRLFLGAGGYWLANPRDDARLFYGGFMGGWRIYGGNRLNVSARALAGVGDGTVFATFSADGLRRPPPQGGAPVTINRRVAVSDEFLVFEPEVDVAFGITNGIRFNVGAGYRATSTNDGLNDLFRGATGSIGVEFDIGR